MTWLKVSRDVHFAGEMLLAGMVGQVQEDPLGVCTGNGSVYWKPAGAARPVAVPADAVEALEAAPADEVVEKGRKNWLDRALHYQTRHGWQGQIVLGEKVVDEERARKAVVALLKRVDRGLDNGRDMGPSIRRLARLLRGFAPAPEGHLWVAAAQALVAQNDPNVVQAALLGVESLLSPSGAAPASGPIRFDKLQAAAAELTRGEVEDPSFPDLELPTEELPKGTLPEEDPLDRIRFEPESQLMASLFERYGLEDLLTHYEDSGEARSFHDLILGTHIRLTPVLAPRIWKLFEEVRAALSFTEPVDLFVHGDADLNASAMHRPEPGLPHVVTLTSGCVERMTDEELRFVLGHELGHLHFQHYRAGLVQHILTDEAGESTMPPLLQRRLETWDRLAELSADRVGFVACGESLETAVSVFFKLTAGLGPEHLKFDIGAFLDQLSAMQTMKRSDLLAQFSHPVTPVRVRALQLFADVGGKKLATVARSELDDEVTEVARLMELQVTRPSEVHSRDFMLAAGLLAAYSDGDEPTKDQHGLLVEMLLPLAADPEEMLDRIETVDEAQDILLTSARWLRDNAGGERFELFTGVCHVLCVDGELSSAERAYALQVATLLGIGHKAAADVLYEVLAGYLQQRSATAGAGRRRLGAAAMKAKALTARALTRR